MLKFHAHDTKNDVALIETQFALWVRYGLQQTEFEKGDMTAALGDFANCQRHALHCEGVFDDEEDVSEFEGCYYVTSDDGNSTIMVEMTDRYTQTECRQWVEGYTRWGDWGGHNAFEIRDHVGTVVQVFEREELEA